MQPSSVTRAVRHFYTETTLRWARQMLTAARRVLVLTTAMLALGCAALCGYVMHIEDSFIYFPTRGGRCSDPGRDVWLTTTDGVRLHARYLPRGGARQVLLYLHGNAGNLAERSGMLELFAGLGANVLALDYRGYGHSAGKPSEAGLYRDADAAYAWLAEHAPGQPIVVLGESLGGGPACELAVNRPIAGLILLSTFTSVPEMAALTFPWLPTRLLVRTRFDNLAKITRVRAPKLFVHSRADEMIPFAMAERLYAAAPPPKQALWLERARHNDAFLVDGAALTATLRAFLR